jgi:8-amino-7-oxononanoate synthase
MAITSRNGSWSSAVGLSRAPKVKLVESYRGIGFADLASNKTLNNWERVGKLVGLKSPFFRTVESADGNFISMDGEKKLNFAWCDYLGLNQHPSVAAAMKLAIDQFGPCNSASRMVSGDTPLHQALEREIASFIGVESSLLFVSGHAANVSTIGSVMGEEDLILHDEFVHNSVYIGMRLSHATAIPFRHNDFDQLEQLLKRERANYRNCLIAIEGLYSTEGDVTDLPTAIELKQRFGAWLMVDDAHGLGVLGKTGRGIAEHAGVDPKSVDIWMGTLSKTLASSGGYIAGEQTLIDVLKHTAPGFVYSVALLPATTAAALAGLRVIKNEPARVARLHENGRLFLATAEELGLNTGNCAGYGMMPVIAGDVIKTIKLWHAVVEAGINPSLIVYPAVPMKAGRLRFFLTAEHTPEQITMALDTTAKALSGL